MIVIYCKTSDGPREVGELICRVNSSEGLVWRVVDEVEPDCWTIETHCDRFAHALAYRVGRSVVAVEVKVECASNVIEPLMDAYGFESVKWLQLPHDRS